MNETINIFASEITVALEKMHFIRAEWFYAFIPLILFLFLSYKKSSNNKNWINVIDHNLLPFVLSKTADKQRRYPLILVFIAGSLCITALAGPVYKKLPQPVYREQSSLIVLLDLSRSMNASDIKPSRLSRAKLELLDLLKTRKTGQTALIVYAANAFVVTPLTDDNATIANLVPSLETSMMPAQGSNLTNALVKAFALFTQSGINKGDILVITDGIQSNHEDAIKKVTSQGHRLSILGIGTSSGAPVPLSDEEGGGFLLDSNGAIVIPKLQSHQLQHSAITGGGLYTSLQADDSDINKLSALFESSRLYHNNDRKSIDDKKLNADIWREEGHWLLLPLLLLCSLWARKGWLAIILLFILPLPQPAFAAAIDTEHLWLTPDQKAMKAFKAGDIEKAAKEFTKPEWKASAYYRSGNFEESIKALDNANTSDHYYNKANALAKLGQYEKAIKAYDKAIELDKNNDDAVYNRDQVKAELQKNKQNSQSKQNGESQEESSKENKPEKNNEKNKKNTSESKKSDKNNDQQDDKKQDSAEKDGEKQDNSEQKNKKNSASKQSENNKSGAEQSKDDTQNKSQEENELKQRDAQAETKKQQQEQQQYQKDQQELERQQEKQDKSDKKADENKVKDKQSNKKPTEVDANPVEASITEDEKATEQWLKRIPDDPGGLLRRKFYYQYKSLPNQVDDNKPW